MSAVSGVSFTSIAVSLTPALPESAPVSFEPASPEPAPVSFEPASPEPAPVSFEPAPFELLLSAILAITVSAFSIST